MKAKSGLVLLLIALPFVFLWFALRFIPEAPIFFGEPPMPDVRMSGYAPAEIFGLMASIGPEGRAAYLAAQLKMDWAIPALNGAMLAGLLWAVGDGLRTRRGVWSSQQALRLGALGLVSPLLDVIENLLLREIMLAGPAADPAAIAWASTVTQAKYATAALTLLLIVALGLWRWRQHGARRAT